MPPAPDECFSCFAQGVELVRFCTGSPVMRALESLGARTAYYCRPCLACAVCGLEVAPGEGAPASKETLRLRAMHRICLSRNDPAADDFSHRLRLILSSAGDQTPEGGR